MPSPGLYVQNLAEVQAWLRQFEPRLVPALRDELKRAVNTTVKQAVVRRVPKRSGTAAASVRGGSGGNTVYIIAGSAKAPYFGWLDFGGYLRPTGRRRNTISRPKVTTGRYLYPGIAESGPVLVEAAGRAVDRIINL
jgi:hypothetical protein